MSILYMYMLLLDQDTPRIESNTFCLINSREDFMCIPELAINPIGDRIIDGFFMNEDSQ